MTKLEKIAAITAELKLQSAPSIREALTYQEKGAALRKMTVNLMRQYDLSEEGAQRVVKAILIEQSADCLPVSQWRLTGGFAW